METITTKSFGRRLAEGRQTNGRRPVDAPEVQPRKGKSKIANGSAIVSGVPQNSVWCRRLKEILADHLSDIPNASAAERSIIRRASVLEVELERLETKFASAGEATAHDLDLYQRVSSAVRRLFEAIGLQRRSKTVTSLTDLLAEDHARQAEVLAEQREDQRETFRREREEAQR